MLASAPFGARWLRRCISARRAGERSKRTTQLLAARVEAVSGLWFLIMLLYPQLSTTIFSVLRCRALGESSAWLEADYSVSCLSHAYAAYRASALVLVVVVPVGIPLWLLWLLLRQRRRSGDEWEKEEMSLRSLAVSQQDFRRDLADETFGFITGADSMQPRAGCCTH